MPSPFALLKAVSDEPFIFRCPKEQVRTFCFVLSVLTSVFFFFVDTYKAALFVDMVPFENPFVDSLSPSESMELINLDCDGADAEDLV